MLPASPGLMVMCRVVWPLPKLLSLLLFFCLGKLQIWQEIQGGGSVGEGEEEGSSCMSYLIVPTSY